MLFPVICFEIAIRNETLPRLLWDVTFKQVPVHATGWELKYSRMILRGLNGGGPGTRFEIEIHKPICFWIRTPFKLGV
jgi:hypothetical protein